MVKSRRPLRIPKDLLEKSELTDSRKAAWKILTSDKRLFQETDDHYELLSDNLIELVSAECGVEAGGRDNLWALLHGYCGNASSAEIDEVRQLFFNDEGVAIELPRELTPGKTLRSAVLQAAVAHSSVEGEDLREMGRNLEARRRGQNGRRFWQTTKLANLEGSPLSILTISTETGMLTAGPARDLDHRGTQVLDRENARLPIGFFVGGVDDPPFQKIFGRAIASWLSTPGGDGEEAEKLALSESKAIRSLVASKDSKLSLSDFLSSGGEDDLRDFFKLLARHGRRGRGESFAGSARRRAEGFWPIHLTTGMGGDVHLGLLPPGLLQSLLQEGRKARSVAVDDSGETKDAPLALFLGEEDGDRFVEQYAAAWGGRRRGERLNLIRETMAEVEQGSIGFLEIIKGGTTLGGHASEEGWVRSDMEDSVARLLRTIESHYRKGLPKDERIPPAGLVDLCDKFLGDDKGPSGEPTKRAERLAMARQLYSSHTKPSFGDRNTFYQAVATYMVERFGTESDRGAGKDTLVKELSSLVGAGDRTQFLYVITDPAGRTTKVGITNNLQGRLEELERENGIMIPVACYAIKSIPVAQWGTKVVDFLTERNANCGLGGEEKDQEARRVARDRWVGLSKIFGFGGGAGERETPSHTLEFFCEGVSNMIRDEGREISDFTLPQGAGKTEVDKVRGRLTTFLRKSLQRATEKNQSFLYPDQFIESVTNLWIRTQGSISFGDASSQRDCITNVNNAISSLFTLGGSRGGAEARVKSVLNAAAELGAAPAGEKKISDEILQEISRYGEHLGAKAFEWDIHQFLQPARMGKSEMFYVGTNYPVFLDIIEDRMGNGVAGTRFALGRDDEGGRRLRMIKEDLSLSLKPVTCLGAGAVVTLDYKRLKDNAEIWSRDIARDVPMDKAGREQYKDSLRARIIAHLCGGGGGREIEKLAVRGVLGGLDGRSPCSKPCPLGDESLRREWISNLKKCGTGDNPALSIKGGATVSREALLAAAYSIDSCLSRGGEVGSLLKSLAVMRNEAEESPAKGCGAKPKRRGKSATVAARGGQGRGGIR